MGAEDSVEARIIADVIDTLKSVTLDTAYHHTFHHVEELQAREPESFPTVFVGTTQEQVRAVNARGACDYYKVELSFSVLVWLRGPGDELPAELRRAKQDVLRAMDIDTTRGGNCSDTNYVGSVRDLLEGTGPPIGIETINFMATYLFKRGEPETLG